MRRLRRALPSASPLLFSRSFSSLPPCGRPAASLPPVEPPRPKKIPFTVSAHGRSWQDPYHWMSDTRDPDLLEHLRRENLYADAFMSDAEGLRRRLVSEMRGRMPAKVSTPPERWGPWLYYQYIPESREYPILCRRWGGHNIFSKVFSVCMKSFEKEEILLDWNELAEHFGYVHVGTCRVSPNHRFLAYTVDTSGGELFMLQIKDLQTGQIVKKPEVNGVVSLAWAISNDRLFYTVCDDTQRPCRVLCTIIRSDAEDVLVFTEKDTSCCLDITSTKDGKFITINSNTRASSEVHVVDSANEENKLWLVQKRVTGVQYFLEHHHGVFYILTNASSEYVVHDSGGYHLARCSAGRFPFTNWQFQDIIIPGQDDTFQDMDIFDGHLVLFLQRRDLPMLCSIELPIDVDCKVSMQPFQVSELKPWYFPLPSKLCSIIPGSNHDFKTSSYRVVISSPVMPDLIVDYNMSKKNFTVVHQEEVLGMTKAYVKAADSHFNYAGMDSHDSKHRHSVDDTQSWDDLSAAFYCERTEVVSHDETKVPLTILYSHQAWQPGRSPGLLHGYGAYGETLDKSWCANRLSLLDRGWVLAFADVRGGGVEPSWHEAGTGPRKLNSILDFVACGMYLVKEGFVPKDKLCAIGCSAGGLLVGATMNMYPDLFCAAILKVPFLDMCNTMLDPSLPLTSLDYQEFGDPRIESEFETMCSYSPYDNIPIGICLPSMLVTTSFHDSRVGVWEAAKWVARLRENSCSTCSRMVLLRTNMTGGHFSEGGRFSQCEDVALEYAFLIKAVGMLDNEDQSDVP